MNGVVHKTRLEIIRKNQTINMITPTFEDSDDFEMSSNSSVNSFPTLSIKSSIPEVCNPFMDFAKSDIVRMSVSSSHRDEYITLFEGEFNKKKTKIEGEAKKLILEIEAIHSFFKLSLFELRSSKEFMGVSFKEFVSSLIGLAGISSRVEIDRELSDLKLVGLSHRTNAFRLFKEVCFIINAAVTFNTNNTVNIDHRAKRLAKIRDRNIHRINEKDIINMDFEETI